MAPIAHDQHVSGRLGVLKRRKESAIVMGGRLIGALFPARGCFAFLGAVALTVTGGDAIIGDDHERRELQERRLHRLAANQTLGVEELFGAHAGLVCVLSPYAVDVSLAGLEGQRLNAYLKEQDVVILEDEWGFAIAGTNETRLSRFKRSGQLDLLPAQVVRSSKLLDAHPEFEPQDCVASRDAVLRKVDFGGRDYLVLGRMRQ
ncbi:hypothetical protein [Pseudomonas oryzihabitans]|uniref:hypothetical protein n=1 Tax=Pseudomonas oryzihabitans TaxID=47885 RepID=UPI00119CB32D|nr:hypothetical protein [Pseudomonas psychrotolerans]